jgi:RimJ/RimL family protein N-acetyltransferase
MDAPLLEGRHVRLTPLSAKHAEALFEVARDPQLFRYLPLRIPDIAAMQAFVAQALVERDAGRTLPFAIELRDGSVVGTTRFGAIEPAHARAEIGWTWLSAKVQRTPVNTECKRLLLAHGFDALQFNRIEFKTDLRNSASRAAIARLGATQEGVFRRHMIMPNGHLRDTVWFSILREEWPSVRQRLDDFLARPYSFSPATV